VKKDVPCDSANSYDRQAIIGIKITFFLEKQKKKNSKNDVVPESNACLLPF
jgi:hypothetical protein